MITSYHFKPEEQPALAGSPYVPLHPARRRIAYAIVAVAAGIGSTFCNALVNTNIAPLAGELGLYVTQASWLPAIYVAMNASANLTLVKARLQFGIPAVALGLLALYVLAAAAQLLWPGFTAAIIVRAVDGMTAASLVTLTVYYLMQVFPARMRPLAVVIGLGLPQFGIPLARGVPVEFLATHHWYGLHTIELSVALSLLLLMSLFPLPPNDRSPAFQPLDLLTIALAVPAMLLLCAVLAEGRLLWWRDTPWLGWALGVTIVLITGVWVIEKHRARPLIQFNWLRSADMARFAAIAVLVRLALAEQTYGSVGLLSLGGLTNDQMRALFAVVALAMLGGLTAAVLTLSEKNLPWQVMSAALLIALGAWIDSDADNLTRAPQLFLSQALLGCGTTLFIGPACVYGVIRMLRRGPDFLVTFMVLFSTTQNVGGLAGSALLGSVQTHMSHQHLADLSDTTQAGNPTVANRINLGTRSLSGVVIDPIQRGAAGAGLLKRSMSVEANVLAYNDVFRFVAILATLTALYLACRITLSALQRLPDPRATP